MQWISYSTVNENTLEPQLQWKDLQNLKQWQKFTLYDHNYTSLVDAENDKLICLFNCKKLNRIYSIIGKIQADFAKRYIVFSCSLMDQRIIIGGKWQYQKIELAKFAWRYNERSANNMLIKVNPVNGEIKITLHLILAPNIFEDEHKFQSFMTDQCQQLGEESEIIFNTMMQIIFGQETNQPYLKSSIKINPNFPRYMKIEKLLTKIKTLISTSIHYKIRSDITSAHKERSYFKKIYLSKHDLKKNSPSIQQMALAYQIKFNKRYQENQKKSRDKQSAFIKDYFELQEKNEVQFAKHLNEYDTVVLQTIEKINAVLMVELPVGKHDNNGRYLIKEHKSIEETYSKLQFNEQQFKHEKEILKRMKYKHPLMSTYKSIENMEEHKHSFFILSEDEVPILQYLLRNKHTISISTKLHLMAQVCSFIYFLHKRCIGYFIQIQNIFVNKKCQIRVRDFRKAYYVTNSWTQFDYKDVDFKSNRSEKTQSKTNKSDIKFNQISAIMPCMSEKERTLFHSSFFDPNNLENQKLDVYSLGMVLYRIMFDKYPFNVDALTLISGSFSNKEWKDIWTVETQYFATQGGEIGKIIAHLILKCLLPEVVDKKDNLMNRPYVEWLTVIISEIKVSLNGLY